MVQTIVAVQYVGWQVCNKYKDLKQNNSQEPTDLEQWIQRHLVVRQYQRWTDPLLNTGGSCGNV